MAFKAKTLTTTLVLVVIAAGAGLLHASRAGEREWAAADVCLSKEITGAIGRSIMYRPVRCSAPHKVQGAAAVTDYARLRFEDLNGDGRREAIVEPNAFFCLHMRYCYDPYQYVLSLGPKASPPVRVLSKTYLPHLDGDNLGPLGSR